MLIKGIKDEDFVNYYKPSMFIIFPYCSFKCDLENGCAVCQNSSLAHEPNIDITIEEIAKKYKANPITRAIVCGGLEPFDSPTDLLDFVHYFRRIYDIMDDIVIYTGYTEEELANNIVFKSLQDYQNVIVKFGRYRPNEANHFDKILGVNLASNNQYAKRLDI